VPARRALDHLRADGVTPDERIAEGHRDGDSRWPLQDVQEGGSHIHMEDGAGGPSRWSTLRAMRVLDWFAQGGRRDA
jgi:hypothetical protein